MKVIKFNLNDFEMDVVYEAVKVLRRGGCIVYPTDTVYALGVNALDALCVERLFKIKNGSRLKPIPIMVRDIETAKKFAYIDKKTEKILGDIWPGAAMAILTRKGIIPDTLVANKKTVGIRIPDCSFAQILAENFEEPITISSTKINREPPLIYSRDVMKAFEKSYLRPNLFLDAGDLQNSQSSTILDLTSAKPKITHIGPISKKDLMEMLG
ncbi:threonylcarbamoyl-AMP synthase [Patescibacteria group bacterium]|nr:threonylcarbamoyl-AMP synthase [Patescibacteria group bacterium]MBU2579609.1 threonylcarbamoyl-AMP synthase [Patescibacteria group bacterium]MBU4030730.1 threonylcarbamoyl-AMP synthase [Patescibacteria group bacterium]MBU4082795.1 threonylcarbamoyl-AMP synthase [Patescibacteria group bacterium]